MRASKQTIGPKFNALKAASQITNHLLMKWLSTKLHVSLTMMKTQIKFYVQGRTFGQFVERNYLPAVFPGREIRSKEVMDKLEEFIEEMKCYQLIRVL